MVEPGLPNAVFTGLVTGSIVAMGAIGLALVYSIAEVPNFAHGELLTLGAFMALFVNKPGTTPIFSLVSTDVQSLTGAGLVLLFLLGAGCTLGLFYLLGGIEALKGGWWPTEPPPLVGLATHIIIAAIVGGVVVIGTPSIWVGLLLATVIVGVVAPVSERIIFRQFRDQGASLATMLIVALGVSLILRFGIQAIYGGAARNYNLPPTQEILGVEQYITAAKFFDFYVTGNGIVTQIIDTGPPNNPVVSTAAYSWLLVAVILVAVLVLAYGTYRLRKRAAGGFEAALTISPRISGAIVGVISLAVLALILGRPTGLPTAEIYSTRFRLFPIKILIFLIAVLMFATLHVLLQETKLGTAMRASSDNLDLAKVTGINTSRVMMATWIIAGLFAGIAGVMLALTLSRVQVNMGFFLLLPMFAAVILGGIRSIYGVIIGSFLVGLAMDVGFTLLPVGNQYRVPIAFVVLFVVLLVKPEGIVGGGGS